MLGLTGSPDVAIDESAHLDHFSHLAHSVLLRRGIAMRWESPFRLGLSLAADADAEAIIGVLRLGSTRCMSASARLRFRWMLRAAQRATPLPTPAAVVLPWP
jgi:hypothetical protein